VSRRKQHSLHFGFFSLTHQKSEHTMNGQLSKRATSSLPSVFEIQAQYNTNGSSNNTHVPIDSFDIANVLVLAPQQMGSVASQQYLPMMSQGMQGMPMSSHLSGPMRQDHANMIQLMDQNSYSSIAPPTSMLPFSNGPFQMVMNNPNNLASAMNSSNFTNSLLNTTNSISQRELYDHYHALASYPHMSSSTSTAATWPQQDLGNMSFLPSDCTRMHSTTAPSASLNSTAPASSYYPNSSVSGFTLLGGSDTYPVPPAMSNIIPSVPTLPPVVQSTAQPDQQETDDFLRRQVKSVLDAFTHRNLVANVPAANTTTTHTSSSSTANTNASQSTRASATASRGAEKVIPRSSSDDNSSPHDTSTSNVQATPPDTDDVKQAKIQKKKEANKVRARKSRERRKVLMSERESTVVQLAAKQQALVERHKKLLEQNQLLCEVLRVFGMESQEITRHTPVHVS